MGRSADSLGFARSLGFDLAWTEDSLPDLPFDAVIDASNAAHLPAKALGLVEPAGRLVYVGLAGSRSLVDTRGRGGAATSPAPGAPGHCRRGRARGRIARVPGRGIDHRHRPAVDGGMTTLRL
jgi:threonine dehydrogenase-like Zn-dependent dehydrogenase